MLNSIDNQYFRRNRGSTVTVTVPLVTDCARLRRHIPMFNFDHRFRALQEKEVFP